jgi:hypothetical protein
MIYEVYAMFREGAYHVATGNNGEHAADLCARVCHQIGQWPMAIATLTRGEHILNCQIFTLDQLKTRKD